MLRPSVVGLASFLEEAAGEGHLTLPAAAEEGEEGEEAYQGCFRDSRDRVEFLIRYIKGYQEVGCVLGESADV